MEPSTSQSGSQRSFRSHLGRPPKNPDKGTSTPTRNGDASFKDKYTALRDQFTDAQRRNVQIQRQLADYETKAYGLQDEIDLLLDALLLAAQSDATPDPSLARIITLDDALGTPAHHPHGHPPPGMSHYPAELLPPLPHSHGGSYTVDHTRWDDERASEGYAPQAAAVTYAHGPPHPTSNGSSRGPHVNGDTYGYEYDAGGYYDERARREQSEYRNGHGQWR